MNLQKNEDFWESVNRILQPDEKEAVKAYIAAGGELPPPAKSVEFYQLHYNGVSSSEIAKLNPEYEEAAILAMRVLYKWDDLAINEAMRQGALMVGKVHKAQMDAASVMSEMIAVVHKKNSDSYRKYLQSGDPSVLAGAMLPDSPEKLVKIVEGLVKLVYRDEQSVSLKIPVHSLQTSKIAIQDQVGQVAKDALSLMHEIAEGKRVKERERIKNQNLEMIKKDFEGDDGEKK